MTKILTGGPLPNIPWEDKPASVVNAPVWRFSGNPVIDRNPVKGVARIFNSAVAPFWGTALSRFCAASRSTASRTSTWAIPATHPLEDRRKPRSLVDEEGKPFMPGYAYDPRLVKVEDTYYIMWCTDFYGAAIGLARTKDFKTLPWRYRYRAGRTTPSCSS